MHETRIWQVLQTSDLLCNHLTRDIAHRIYDAKFYPFALPDNDHIFAAVAETDVEFHAPSYIMVDAECVR
jgi:hypothetical protein